MAGSLAFRSAVELRADIAARRVSPVEIVDHVLDRIARLDGRIGSYYTIDGTARAAAQAAERAVRDGEPLGPLHGIPISVKDLIMTAGLRTTRGSAMFEDFVPAFSAPAVERALAAGAILIGKTATSELGWKPDTECPLFGMARNPWDLARSPGGSSGGASAAVAAGFGPLALATDAGGSTRQPAAYCGVFGMKPSFGRVPIYPAPIADSLVHVGLMARTVADCALLLSVIAGPDERDRNSLPAAAELAPDAPPLPLPEFRLAWCPNFGGLPADPEMLRICEAAVRGYERAGIPVDEIAIDLPDTAAAFDVLFKGLFGAQVIDALPRWRDRMDPDFVAFIEAGAKLSAYELAKTNPVRAALWEALRKVFERHPFLLLPVAGALPHRLDGDGAGARAPVTERLGFVYPFNLTGQPAASIPCGWTEAGLPVGIQLVGRRFQDRAVLQVAARCEAILPWADRMPAWTI